ncbi:hypothetical protein VE03_08666 [Pseudogymnoascus sp. 23342-1-I1]|nr:hypothetical protein VE03_08666 [Pseudogymnoascus sp. 23342-1-I1]
MPHEVGHNSIMRAAQFNTIAKKITVNEIPIPSCKPHEILIKNKCASLCHSDLMLFWDSTAEPTTTEDVTTHYMSYYSIGGAATKMQKISFQRLATAPLITYAYQFNSHHE